MYVETRQVLFVDLGLLRLLLVELFFYGVDIVVQSLFKFVDTNHGENVTETDEDKTETENEGEASDEHRHGEEGFRRIHGTQHAGKSKLFFSRCSPDIKKNYLCGHSIIDCTP